MRAIGGENLKKWEKMQEAALGSEEKILVLVRLRPLSEKEIMRNEVSDWECINEITILYRNSLQERSGLPTAYTIATIFAYGQISSGNTYTMNGVTKFTVTDIYDYIQKTIESSACEFIGKDNKTTLSASMNFIDLAGSERASHALSDGKRLKEGCHINHSLLTLETVIHKLSHVEQSQNTLLFACCAKEVTTNAQVNVVMSDKALVKHLQKELARLESEFKTPITTYDHVVLLRTKDQQIKNASTSFWIG
ncbi:putative kinesin-like protein NACK1-like isoform X9 [Capsicum annuum]|nr:putative kinesin-like protein NACK1-like isoform X9 [Capsicum annuum]